MSFSNRIGPDILRTHWMLYFKPLKKWLYKRLGSCGANVDIRPHVSLIGMNNIHLGDNVVLRPNTTIVADNNCNVTVTIEADALIGPGVYMTSANHRFADPSRPIHKQGHDFKSIRIKRGAWLGYGVVVLPGVTIGEQAVIGAGAVVTRDIPDFAVAVGVPARVVKIVGEQQPAL